MRIVKFTGYIIFNPEESNYGENMVDAVEHELYNVDGVVEWEFTELSNEEVEYEEDE